MRGIISALVIPFTKEGKIDFEGLKEVIDYNIEVSKIDGLYINGSTGENFTLTTDEKKEIFKVVVKHNQNRVKLIAHIGSINLHEAIDLAKYVEKLEGYEAISAITPFYYKFNFAEIKAYYQQITSVVDLPMIAYYIPVLTGVKMSLVQIGELLELDNVIGIKYTDNDFYLLEQVRHQFPNKLIYSGFDEMLIASAIIGVDGAIGSTYNYQGFIAKAVLEAVKNGEVETARTKQHELNETITMLIQSGLYPTIKAVLRADGVKAGNSNKPFSITTDEQLEVGKVILNKIK